MLDCKDLESLCGTNYVNDTVIDYFIKKLECSRQPEAEPRMLFSNCFFYTKLSEGRELLNAEDEVRIPLVDRGSLWKNTVSANTCNSMQDAGLYGYNNVRRWTVSQQCLDQDFIFVPVHSGLHWCVIASWSVRCMHAWSSGVETRNMHVKRKTDHCGRNQ
jgi:Ulp1 family protease